MDSLEKLVSEIVSDSACCDRTGCRCWQAVSDLKRIKEYCESEINKSPYEDLKEDKQ